MPKCTVHTSRYLPRRVTRRSYEPLALVRERKRCGPSATVTLCRALPRHRNLTVSPLRTVSEAGRKKLSCNSAPRVAAGAGIVVAVSIAPTVAMTRTLLITQ